MPYFEGIVRHKLPGQCIMVPPHVEHVAGASLSHDALDSLANQSEPSDSDVCSTLASQCEYKTDFLVLLGFNILKAAIYCEPPSRSKVVLSDV